MLKFETIQNNTNSSAPRSLEKPETEEETGSGTMATNREEILNSKKEKLPDEYKKEIQMKDSKNKKNQFEEGKQKEKNTCNQSSSSPIHSNAVAPDAITRRIHSTYKSSKGSIIKSLLRLAGENTISLAGGTPLPLTYPFRTMTIEGDDDMEFIAANKSKFEYELENHSKNSECITRSNNNDNNINGKNGLSNVESELSKDISCKPLWFRGDDIDNLQLNYVLSSGVPGLQEAINKMTLQILTTKRIPYEDWASILTNGGTDGLYKIFHLLQPICTFIDYSCSQNGNSHSPLRPVVLTEQLVWPAIKNIASYTGYDMIGIPVDEYGIDPTLLEEAILKEKNPERIAFLYLTPTGQNPTGTTMSLERKKRIYSLACQYDLVIVEDDPYRMLSLPPAEDCFTSSPSNGHEFTDTNAQIYNMTLGDMPGLRSLPISFLEIDVEGRVLRVESISKWICPGLRIGWLTGPKTFMQECYRPYSETTSQFPSTISQISLRKLIEHWFSNTYNIPLGHSPEKNQKEEMVIRQETKETIGGSVTSIQDMKTTPTLEMNGFELHIRRLQLHYSKQRNAMLQALEKYLKPYCVWNPPKAGMFTWIEIKDLKSTSSSPSNELTSDMIRTRNEKIEKLTFEMVESDILVVPGYSFDVSNGHADPAFRLTYSCSSPKEIDIAVGRMATVLSKYF